MTRKEGDTDIPFLNSLNYLNESDKQFYLEYIRKRPLLIILRTLMRNFDNWLGHIVSKFRKRDNAN